MKKHLLQILFLSVSLIVPVDRVLAIPILSMDFLGSNKINVGQTAIAVLNLSGLDPNRNNDFLLAGFQVDIGFDSDIIEFSGVHFGASLGDSFELSKLASVSGLGEGELLELLEEAFERRFLLCEGETFEFRHPLIRHVFYSAPSVARARIRTGREGMRSLSRFMGPCGTWAVEVES